MKAPLSHSVGRTSRTEAESSARHSALAHKPPVGASPRQIDAGRLAQMGGNLAMQRLLQSGAIHAKLWIGQASDPAEQEADRVARQVVDMPAAPSPRAHVPPPAARLAAAKQEAPLVQRSPAPNAQGVQPAPDVDAKPGAGGSALPPDTRSFMESRFGADFSAVRLHTDPDAAAWNRAIHAQAFTHGSHIYLGEGRGDLGSPAGKLLLAHELTHTIQQGENGRNAVAMSPLLQRQPLPSAPSPAPAPGVNRPGSPVPIPGATKAETDPVELPVVAARLPITFTSTRRDLKLTTEDLSEFEILKGEFSPPPIPLLDTGISVKVSAKADVGVRLANLGLFLTPIAGEIEASQIVAAQSKPGTLSKVGAAAGGIIGGLAGGALGLTGGLGGMVLGARKGAGIGGIAGGKAGESLAELFAGDTELKATLTQGGAGGTATLTYSPELTVALSGTGLSWLATFESTLATNLQLTLEALIDFAGSSVSLTFRNGHLLPSEFQIQPVIRPSFKAAFDASGQLMARLVLLPFLRGEKPAVGEEEAIVALEVHTVPFHLFNVAGGFNFIDGDLVLTASKSSPMEIRKKHLDAEPGKVPAAFKGWLSGSGMKADVTKEGTAKAPESSAGPHTGLTEDDAIPFTWWKPFDEYLPFIYLPAAHFGTERKVGRFINKPYKPIVPGTDLMANPLLLGVNDWPYAGMKLKKAAHQRGGAETAFRENLRQFGVDLSVEAPGYQIDHVIDLQYHKGYDQDLNLWPLKGDVNMAAGSKYSLLDEVTWLERKGGPLRRSTPAAVPAGRWFVISGAPRKP